MSEFVRGNIGILTTGTVPDYFFDTAMLLDLPKGTQIIRRSNMRTDEARNQCVEHVLSVKTSEWLFFMDSDMVFPRRALMRLLSWKKDVVGGLYFLRRDPFEPVAYDFNPEETAKKGLFMYSPIVGAVGDFFMENKEHLPLDGLGHRIVPIDEARRKKVHPLRRVDGIGTGCLLIRRRVLEKIPAPWFSYAEGGTEDLYFCRRAKEAGFEIYVDMGCICGHMQLTEVSYPHFANWFGLVKQQAGSA